MFSRRRSSMTSGCSSGISIWPFFNNRSIAIATLRPEPTAWTTMPGPSTMSPAAKNLVRPIRPYLRSAWISPLAGTLLGRNAAWQEAQVAALADADDDRVALQLGLIARDDLRPDRAVRSFGQDRPCRAHAAHAAFPPQDLRYRRLVG